MQLHPHSGNKAPEGVQCVEVLTHDGVRLRAAYAIPKNPKGTVLILGGRAEFIERYFETMSDLLRRGYAVATFDWRGQGGSQRLIAGANHGHINSYASYDADIDAVYTRILVAQCPKPFYGLAHSTGGHILLRALRGKKWLERAVITAPLMGLHFGTWPKPVAKGLAAFASLVGLSQKPLPGFSRRPVQSQGFTGNPLTSDRKRWDRDETTLKDHPELGTGAPTYGWLRATLNSLDELHSWPAMQGPSCPTLIVLAGLDRVVDNRGTKKFLAHAPGFSSLTIADSQHEILNEKPEIRERFLAACEAFISG
jgi:lysophospholipase